MTTGRVTTFYSFKGGVGRTLLLANVAWLLARWGRRVLCLDWDLEAPGLHRYLAPQAPPKRGVLDLVLGLGRKAKLREWPALTEEVGGPWTGAGALHLIGAGQRDDEFIRNVQGLRYDELSACGLEVALEGLRSEWVAHYDHVLIDSRTGITDAGGICAAQLPDLLVLTLTATHQSLEGTVDIAGRAQRARASMPLDRGGFYVLPVPCRIHTGEEEELEKEWALHFETQLEPLFEPWKDRSVQTHEYIAHLRVREQARWSFGEQLPVRVEALDDPNRISHALANVAALIDQRLEDSGMVVRQRHDYVLRVAGQVGLGAPDGAAGAEFDVFISYPHSERAAAVAIARELRAKGVRAFSDLDIPLGSSVAEALYRARERSRMFLVLLAERALGAGQTEELAHVSRRMTELGVTVVPVFLSPGAVSHAPPHIGDLFGLVLPHDGPWERVAERIARRLPLRARGEPAASLGRSGVAVDHAARVRALAFGDARTCLSAAGERIDTIKLWDAVTGMERGGFQLPPSHVTLAISADGRFCVSQGGGRLFKWDTAGNVLERADDDFLSVPNPTIGAVSADGRLMVVVAAGKLATWTLDSSRVQTLGSGHGFSSLAISDTANLCITGDEAGNVYLWPPRSERLYSRAQHSPLSAIAIGPGATGCVFGHRDGSLTIWSIGTGRRPLSKRTQTDARSAFVSALAYTPGGRAIVAAYHDGTLELWDVAAGAQLASLTTIDSSITHIAIAPDGRRGIAGNSSGVVRVFDVWMPQPTPTSSSGVWSAPEGLRDRVTDSTVHVQPHQDGRRRRDGPVRKPTSKKSARKTKLSAR